MKLASADQIKQLKEKGPRNKDREFWDISKKNVNNSNYNIWSVWMGIVIEWLEKRKKKKFGIE